MEEEIQHQHFSKCHEHPLSNCNVFSVICSSCGQLISGPAYCCTKNDCKYYIHKYCFKLSMGLQIKHPFHLQHPLTLQYKHQLDHYNPDDDDVIICHACGCDTPDFFFQCSECEFDLDVVCASLMPTDTNEHPIQHLNKKHPLILCAMNKNFKFYCNACTLLIEEGLMLYVCLDCHFLLHRSCVELPLTITHPFHPQHPLTLFSKARNPNQQCNACGCRAMECYFGCYQCSFQLDIRCALMMLTNNHEGCHEYQIQHFGQTHPLILCNMNKNFKLFCSVCTLPFKDLIYVCLECKVLLHKSCFELEVEIQHPSHPQHRLILFPNPPLEHNECSACGDSIDGCHYNCLRDECFNSNFSMHTRCASSLVPTIRSKHHQHPLAFFKNNDPVIKSEYFSCSVCSGDIITSFFRCVKCNFSLHVHCYPTLPQTIKHQCHGHPFTLTYSPVKDYQDEDEDAEFYCDFCEERRNLFEPTYYCVECQKVGSYYVAHFDCLISEVLRVLEEEWALTCNSGDKELDTSTDEVVSNDLITKMEGTKLESPEGATGKVGVGDTTNRACVEVVGNVLITKMEEGTKLESHESATEKAGVGTTNPALVELDKEILTLDIVIEAQKAMLGAFEERRAHLQNVRLEMSDLGNKSD